MADDVGIVIGLGSNIEPALNVPEGVRQLRRHARINVKRVSRIYESPAAGVAGAPDFHNAAVLAVTDLEPAEVREELRRIEERQGRQRTGNRNAPRTLDLDLIYYGDIVAEFDGWRIPAAEASTAPHVVIPVAEIAPDWINPQSGLTTNTLATKLASPSPVLNSIGAEIALDLELLSISDAMVAHTPGKLLIVADALSRLYSPAGDGTLPSSLAGAKERTPKVRDDAFFKVWTISRRSV